MSKVVPKELLELGSQILWSISFLAVFFVILFFDKWEK